MPGTLPPIVTELRASTSDFMAKMAEAKAEMADTSSKGSSSFSKLSSLGGVALAGLAAGAVAVGAASIDLASKFQGTVTSIAANADISVGAAQKIGTAFLNTAGTTIYSGQAIGSAYAQVAGQLGATQGHALTASQAMTVMSASMDLAEGSGTDLNSATSVLASTMQAFGDKAGKASQVSDVLFNTSRVLGVGVASVGGEFTKLHSTLGAVTPPLGQLGGILIDLTEHGETGRKALSAVNTSLNGLLVPTAAATAAQGLLGVSFVNSQGQFVGMSGVISELQPKLAAMPQAMQLAALKAIGMGTANKALLTTILAGPQAYDKATAAASKLGTAHAAAEKQSQTLGHQLELIKATVEDYGVKLGQILLPKVETLLRDTMSLVEWFGKHKDAAIALAAVVGGVLTAAIGAFAITTVGNFINYLKNAASSVTDLFTSASTTAGEIDAPATEIAGSATDIDTAFTSAATDVATAMASMAESVSAAAAEISASLAGVDADLAATKAEMSGLGEGGGGSGLLGANGSPLTSGSPLTTTARTATKDVAGDVESGAEKGVVNGIANAGETGAGAGIGSKIVSKAKGAGKGGAADAAEDAGADAGADAAAGAGIGLLGTLIGTLAPIALGTGVTLLALNSEQKTPAAHNRGRLPQGTSLGTGANDNNVLNTSQIAALDKKITAGFANFGTNAKTTQALAKDSTVKAQEALLHQLYGQAAQLPPGSKAQKAAIDALHSTERAFLPTLSKDKNTALMVLKLDSQASAAKTAASIEKVAAADTSKKLQGNEDQLKSLQKVAATEKTLGASKQSQDLIATQIRQTNSKIDSQKADISTFTGLAHSFTTKADGDSAEAKLEAAMLKVNTDTSALKSTIAGGITISSLPTTSTKFSGSISLKVS